MIISREQKKQLVMDWESTGLSIKEYCALHGIKTGTFHYWKKRMSLNSADELKDVFSVIELPLQACCIEFVSVKGERIIFNQLVDPLYLKKLMS